MNCAICGKPPSGYPNWLLSKGVGYHVGCLADAYENLKQRHQKVVDMLDAANVFIFKLGQQYGEEQRHAEANP